jgi:hypothetical protein
MKLRKRKAQKAEESTAVQECDARLNGQAGRPRMVHSMQTARLITSAVIRFCSLVCIKKNPAFRKTGQKKSAMKNLTFSFRNAS